MRRRRQWLDDAAASPTSRRRLEDSPTGDIVQQFGNALDTVDITLQLPPNVIDLTNTPDETGEAVDEDVVEVFSDEERDSPANSVSSAVSSAVSSSVSSADIENMIERSVARTVTRAYNEMLAHVSPPGTPPPPPPTMMLPAPPPPRRISLPRTPPARALPATPQAPRRPRRSSWRFPRADVDADARGGVSLETVLLRIRGRREPQLVVRLPGGGFSYAPSPLYMESPTSSPPAPHRARRPYGTTRATDVVRARVEARQNERIRRLRRQLRLDEDELSRMEVRPSDAHQSLVSPVSSELPALAWSALASSLRGAGGGAAQPVQERLIPSFVATEEMGVPEGKCGICLEEFKAGTRVSIIACQPEGASGAKDHVFCHPCIQQWVHACRGHRSCPLCRGAF